MMKEYEEDNFSIKVENGIVFFTFKKDFVDYNYVNDGINKRLELTEGKPFPMLSDFSVVKSGTREAREKLASKEAGLGVTAVAVIMNSKVQKIMYNFFNLIYKSPSPCRIFSNKEDALKWIQKFVK